MKKEPNEGQSAAPELTEDKARRKPYRRPVLRAFGSLHRMTQSTGVSNGDGGQAMRTTMGMGSDRSIKENIVGIGDHPLGIGLYLFDYKPGYRGAWGYGRQFGVMADEVERTLPEAVSIRRDGYKLVDYAMLGMKVYSSRQCGIGTRSGLAG